MLSRSSVKTTFEPERTIRPIYTGGSVALDASGCILATCLGEDAVITDLRTGEELARIEGDGEVLTSLALTPSVSHVVLCSRSLSMYIYALSVPDDSSSAPMITPSLSRTLKPHPSPVITSAVDTTGTLLATGGADGIIKIWDIRGGFVTHTFQGHSGIISALHFFEVTLTGVATLTGISARNTSRGRIRGDGDVEINGDGERSGNTRGFRLASGAEDGKVKIWDLSRRKCISTLDSHVSVVRSLCYSSEEQALVSASRDKTAIIWDARTWKVRRLIPVLESLESAGFILPGTSIFTGGETGRVRIWETSTGREVTVDQAAAESEGENIIDILYHPGTPPYLLSILNDQSLILLSLAALDSTLTSKATIPPLPEYRRISGNHDEVIDLAYLTPSHEYLALATNAEDLRIVSIASPTRTLEPITKTSSVVTSKSYFGAHHHTLTPHTSTILAIATDPSGHWLATASKDTTATLWYVNPSTSTYTLHCRFTGHAESIGAVALPPSQPSPKPTKADQAPLYLLTGSQDLTLKNWQIPRDAHTKTSKPLRASYTRKAHDKDINALDVHPSGILFASASQDRTVKILSVAEGETQGILRGHKRGVWSVKFAPPGTPGMVGASKGIVLTGAGDKVVKLWSLGDYSCLLTLEGHTGSVLRVIWLPPPPSPSTATTDDDFDDDTHTSMGERQRPRQTIQGGQQIASAGGDGLVKIWSLPGGECETTLDNHSDRVWCLATSNATTTPEGTSAGTRQLISGSSDSTVCLWRDTTAEVVLRERGAQERFVESEQRLANLTSRGEYREAIGLALALGHPGRLLGLLSAVAGTESETEEDLQSVSGLAVVDEALGQLGRGQVLTLLRRCRDWNTNARTAMIAQRVLGVVVRAYPTEWLAGLGRGRKGDGEDDDADKEGEEEVAGVEEDGAGEGQDALGKVQPAAGIKELVNGLRTYSERHYKRLEALEEDAWVVEYTLREMAETHGEIDGGRLAVEAGGVGEREDVMMV